MSLPLPPKLRRHKAVALRCVALSLGNRYLTRECYALLQVQLQMSTFLPLPLPSR